MDLLGQIFRSLTELGGGSELVPLVVFCVVLVLIGLVLGLGAMRLLRGKPAQSSASDTD
jgi:hypothetical protein